MTISTFIIADSSIHGKGLFANKNLKKGERIGLGIKFIFGIWPMITPYLGSWINHCNKESNKHNTRLEWDDSLEAYEAEGEGWYLITTKDVKKGDELLMDYADTPFYIEGPQDHYKGAREASLK